MAEENAAMAITTQLAPARGKSSLVPTDLESLYKLAETLSRAGACPAAVRGKPADVFLILLKGAELGIGMSSALANIHVIEGKTVMSSDLMVGVAFSHGVVEVWEVCEWTEEVCTIKAKRRGPASPISVTWTIKMAANMGLLNKKGIGGGPGMWQKVPKQMLWARSAGEAARRIAPDYLAGCYAQEEMDEPVREPRDVTPIVTVAPQDPNKLSKPLSIVARAPRPTLEQGARLASEMEASTVTVSGDGEDGEVARSEEEPPHDPQTGEVLEVQAAKTQPAADDDDSPEIVRFLRTVVDNKTPITRDQLREAMRSIGQIKDETTKLEAKRLYNEASKLTAA